MAVIDTTERAPAVTEQTASAPPGHYRAAVVHEFSSRLTIDEIPRPVLEPGQIRGRGRGHRSLPHRHPRSPRRLARQAVAAVRPGPRGRRDRRGARPRRDRGRARRPRRDAVARLRVRHVRLLRLRLGDALPRAEEHGLLDRRRLRRVRRRLRAATSSRCRTAVDPFDAAPLTCAGVTTYKAIKVAGTRSSDLVAVFGVGGLGHMAIQYARIAGGRVVAVDLHRREARARTRARRRVHGERGEGGPRRRRSSASAEPTRRSRWRSRPRPSSRRTARCAAAARSSSSRCRPTTR